MRLRTEGVMTGAHQETSEPAASAVFLIKLYLIKNVHFTASSHLFMIIDPAAQLCYALCANKTDIYVIQTLLKFCIGNRLDLFTVCMRFSRQLCFKQNFCVSGVCGVVQTLGPSRQTMLPIFLQNNYETFPTSSYSSYNSYSTSTWLLDPCLLESDLSYVDTVTG